MLNPLIVGPSEGPKDRWSRVLPRIRKDAAKPGDEQFSAERSPKGLAAPGWSLESPRGSCKCPGEGAEDQSRWLRIGAAPGGSRSHGVPSPRVGTSHSCPCSALAPQADAGCEK